MRALSALASFCDAAPSLGFLVAGTLGGEPVCDGPAEALLPKGLTFFKHLLDGVTYHGIRYTAANYHARLSGCVDGDPAGDCAGPEEAITVHCAHGFGASSLSFLNLLRAVQQRHLTESNAAVSTWVAHDTLGFGFTTAGGLPLSTLGEHPGDVKQRLSLDANSAPSLSICHSLHPGAALRRSVFVGHSMGAVSAIASAHRCLGEGQPVAGLVLIAPAISTQTIGEDANNFLLAATPLLQSVTSLMKFWHLAPYHVRRSVLAAILKAGVSLDLFWYLGLRFAMGWHQEVTPETMEAYKSPMARANWAPWLVAFIETNLIPPPDAVSQKAQKGREPLTVKDKLMQLLDAGVKVLIVHDPSDTFIPFQNSVDLVDLFGRRIVLERVNEASGHIAHETAPECVLDAMAKHGIPY